MMCDQLKELRDPHKAHFYVKERIHVLVHEAMEILREVQVNSDYESLRECVTFLRRERRFIQNLMICVDRLTDDEEVRCNRQQFVSDLSYLLAVVGEDVKIECK